MNYFLIDYENVKIDDIKNLPGLNEGAVLIIFYSDQHKNISLDVIDDVNALNIKLYCQKVKTGEKNALDFQLASYLGYLIGRGGRDDKYHIVSNDKGYDCLRNYWKGQGKFVDRIVVSAASQPSPDQRKKKKSNAQSGNLATLEEIKQYLSDDENPEQVLILFNQHKSKQKISVDLAKKFRDSKKAGAIYKKLKPLLKEKHKL